VRASRADGHRDAEFGRPTSRSPQRKKPVSRNVRTGAFSCYANQGSAAAPSIGFEDSRPYRLVTGVAGTCRADAIYPFPVFPFSGLAPGSTLRNLVKPSDKSDHADRSIICSTLCNRPCSTSSNVFGASLPLKSGSITMGRGRSRKQS
jgi:hypothetical protein